MKLENQELLKEFYERVKDEYPDLSFHQVRACCSTPFEYTKQEIESGDLPTIRLKYFGTFLVYPKRAKSILTKLERQFKEQKITPKHYFAKKAIIDKFLENEKEA